MDDLTEVAARWVCAWLGAASEEVVVAWRAVQDAARAEPRPMGLSAGERPAADVEVLAGMMAGSEYLLASRLHAAASAGSLPLAGGGGVLAARGWAPALARRLARCGALAATFPAVAAAWASGLITSEHVDVLARFQARFTGPEFDAIVAELGPHWGSWSPAAITRLLTCADRMLHPGPDPHPEEVDSYKSRALSFAVSGDRVLVSGELPRVEGELVLAAVDALAERLRSTAENVPAAARRADALVQLVNDAHAAGVLPTRGGLPVALTVSLQHTALGDPVWRTGRGHALTPAEARWASCDAAITPVLVDAHQGWADPPEGEGSGLGGGAGSRGWPTAPSSSSPAARIAALASTMFTSRLPLEVGRTQRTATPAQRRALALRDRGCLIPACQVPAEACQTHHLVEWADGGSTDVDNLVLLCWAHHRQVDLSMWRITALPLDDPGPPRGSHANDVGPPGTAGRGDVGSTWPANNGAPFEIARTPRNTWRI